MPDHIHDRSVVVDTTRSPFARLRPLAVAAVRLDDVFWAPRRRVNRDVSLQDQYEQCETSGRLDNFRRVTGASSAPFQGRFFNDSDIYKWIEAAAWTLASAPDPVLSAQVDTAIALIAAAQDDDGYLNTYFSLERAGERWSDLAVMHELYCAGHLMQAAVAHHRATGSRALLDVTIRYADHIDGVFGPDRHLGAGGHPEVEMGLVELARETGQQRYLRLAQFFVDQRGQQPPTISGKEYHLDHTPVREQREVVGHAVRALYLYAGVTDLYAETGERALWTALEALWHNLHDSKAYVTGGAGARYLGESFGHDYELPNERAYAETCAAIASVMWNWRLLLVTGQARFADALETALYNSVLSGVSLDGRLYFYQNPLADRGGHRRQPWFVTACCPPNIARLLASLPGYLYTTSDEGLWVHLYAASTVTAVLPGVGEVTLRQQTTYPWDGEIACEVQPREPAEFSLFLRVPAWAAGAQISVNGAPAADPVEPQSYVELRRRWSAGDVVRLTLPMPVRLLSSHPHVTNNLGRVALLRGPLVYCVEAADHPDVDVWDLALPADAAWEVARQADLLGGVMVARTEALASAEPVSSGSLYRPYAATPPDYRPTPLTAIPYYAWANREPGPMQVWLPIAPLA